MGSKSQKGELGDLIFRLFWKWMWNSFGQEYILMVSGFIRRMLTSVLHILFQGFDVERHHLHGLLLWDYRSFARICDERLWEWVLGECIGVSFGDVVSLGILDFRRNSASLTRRIGMSWNNICQVSKIAITECGTARVELWQRREQPHQPHHQIRKRGMKYLY